MIDLFLIITGLAVGSFLNVVIYRLPRHMQIIFSRSRCPKCGKQIKFYDNIPVISYIVLRGKCRYCGSPISLRYPFVEILTALLFWASYRLTNNLFDLIISLYLSSAMVAITFIDIDHRIIPNIITYPGVIVGILSSLVRYNFGLIQSLLGAGIGFGIMTLIAIVGTKAFKREAMGFGDVKLMALTGSFVGPQKVLFTILIASCLGAIFGLIGLLLAKDKESARLIPFGPYIAVASLLMFWWGDKIISWYLALFSL